MSTRANWLKVMIQYPGGALERLRGEWDRRQDTKAWNRVGMTPHQLYEASPDAAQRLHTLLGMPWPCPEYAASAPIVEQMNREFALGEEFWTDVNPGFSELRFFDADVTISRVAWCVARHLAPARVVETGVARGVTSRFLLEAIKRNGSGTLWSIDLPHARTSQGGKIGSAVPDRLRGPWRLLLGPSRRHLPQIVKTLDEIDIFVHDSLHTSRNVQFELECVWNRIKPGGVILVDDVNENLAFQSFVRAVHSDAWVVGRRLLGVGLWGAIVKKF